MEKVPLQPQTLFSWTRHPPCFLGIPQRSGGICTCVSAIVIRGAPYSVSPTTGCPSACICTRSGASARLNPHLHQRERPVPRRQPLQHTHMRDRAAPVCPPRRHPRPPNQIARDRQIHRDARPSRPLHAPARHKSSQSAASRTSRPACGGSHRPSPPQSPRWSACPADAQSLAAARRQPPIVQTTLPRQPAACFPMWCSSAFTSVPRLRASSPCPAPACTIIPAGLFTTASHLSSYRMSSGMSSGVACSGSGLRLALNLNRLPALAASASPSRPRPPPSPARPQSASARAPG